MESIKLLLISPTKGEGEMVGNFIFFQDKFFYEVEDCRKFKEQTEFVISTSVKITISINPDLEKNNVEDLSTLITDKIKIEQIRHVFLIKSLEKASINHDEDLLFQKLITKNNHNENIRFYLVGYFGGRDDNNNLRVKIEESLKDTKSQENAKSFLNAYSNFLTITSKMKKNLKQFIFNFYLPSKFFESFFENVFESTVKLNATDTEIVEFFIEKGHYLGEIIVTGCAGQGKSTFINSVFNKSLAETGGIERASGVSKFIVPYKDFFHTDKKTDYKVRLYDMPGYGDLTVSKEMLIRFWKENLCRKEIKFVLFVKRVDQNRIMSEEKVMLEIFVNCVVESGIPSENIIFVATHCDKMDSEEQSNKAIQAMIKTLNDRVKLKIHKFVKFTKTSPVPALKELFEMCINTKTTLKLNADLDMDKAKKIIWNSISNGEITCFSSDSIVKLQKGDFIIDTELSNVEISDRILTSCNKFERVLAISRCYENRNYRLLKFSFSNNQSCLKLSEFHYIYVLRGNQMNRSLAIDIKQGDKLFFNRGNKFDLVEVVRIETDISSYLINLRTESGRVIVNDILCSTETKHDLGRFGQEILLLADKIHPKLPQKLNLIGNSIQKAFNY